MNVIFFTSIIVGIVLLVISTPVLWVRYEFWGSKRLQSWIERTFLHEQDLFDRDATYAATVFWLQWPAFVTALTTVLPFTMILHDLIVLLVAIVLLLICHVLWWIGRFFKTKAIAAAEASTE